MIFTNFTASIEKIHRYFTKSLTEIANSIQVSKSDDSTTVIITDAILEQVYDIITIAEIVKEHMFLDTTGKLEPSVELNGIRIGLESVEAPMCHHSRICIQSTNAALTVQGTLSNHTGCLIDTTKDQCRITNRNLTCNHVPLTLVGINSSVTIFSLLQQLEDSNWCEDNTKAVVNEIRLLISNVLQFGYPRYLCQCITALGLGLQCNFSVVARTFRDTSFEIIVKWNNSTTPLTHIVVPIPECTPISDDTIQIIHALYRCMDKKCKSLATTQDTPWWWNNRPFGID